MKRGSGTLIPIEIQPPDPSVRRGLWPVQPVPAATESLSSWLGRTALGNGLAPADVLAELRRLRVRKERNGQREQKRKQASDQVLRIQSK